MPRKVQSVLPYHPKNSSISTRNIQIPGNSFMETTSFSTMLLKKILAISGRVKISITSYDDTKDFGGVANLMSECDPVINFVYKENSVSYPKIFRCGVHYTKNNQTKYASGSSLTSEKEAVYKCCGEFLERYHLEYTASLPTIFQKIQAQMYKYLFTAPSLLDVIPKPLPSQKIFSQFPTNEEFLTLTTTLAYNTSKDRHQRLPVSCMYYGVPERYFLHHETSNGGGGGITLEDARLSAVYEFIERDSFLLYWLAGISPPQIDISTLPKDLREYMTNTVQLRYKLELYILNTSYDTGIFSCFVVLVDRISTRVSIGGAAGIDIEKIIYKAYTESLNALHFSHEGVDCSPSYLASYIPFENTSGNLEARASFYNNEYGLKLFESLFLSGPQTTFDSIPKKIYATRKDELDAVVLNFKKLSQEKGDGYNLFFKEHSSKMLTDYSYIVSKCYIPSLYTLWLKESLATPMSKRLIDFAKVHGKIIASPADINTLPHPFP